MEAERVEKSWEDGSGWVTVSLGARVRGERMVRDCGERGKTESFRVGVGVCSPLFSSLSVWTKYRGDEEGLGSLNPE